MDQPQAGSGSRAALDALIRLIENGYERDPVHSLLANLKSFKDEDWTVYLPGAGRSVGDIVEHVAWCKWMYEDYAFGSKSLAGDQPPMVPANGARSRPRAELIDFLAEGHRRWLGSVRRLADDSELDTLRHAHWGSDIPTRDIIHINISHDLYHAGEINHLRALLQGTDRWPYD